MQAPLFRSAGAKTNGTTGAITPSAPAGIDVGDLEILVASTIAGGSLSITNNGGGAWTAIPNTPVDVAGGEKLYAWYRVRQAGDGDPQVTPGSDHSIATRLCYWGGTFDSTTPIEIAVNGSEATSDTSFSFAPGTSTSEDGCVVLCVSTSGVDSTTAQVPVCTNASLTALASRFNGETSNGGGGGFGITEGTKATAGTVGTFACTYTSASPKAYLSFAIRPYVPAAFPGTLAVLDDFNRASLGAAYVAPAFGAANAATISGSQLAGAGTNSTCAKTDAVVPNPFDAYIEVPTLPASGNISWDFLCSSALSTVNCYQLFITASSNSWTIRRLDAGAATALGAAMTQALAAGDAIGIRYNGGYIEAWIRHSGVWSFVGARFDDTYTADGYFGWTVPDATTRLDNLYVTAAGGHVLDIGVVVGSGFAQSFGRSKARGVGFVLGSGLAQPFTRARARALGLVTGGGVAEPFGRAKSRAVGAPVEAGVAEPFARSKVRALGFVLGTGVAQAVVAGRARLIGVVTESGFAMDVGRRKSAAVGFVLETGVAQAVGRAKTRAVGVVTGLGVVGSIRSFVGIVQSIGAVVESGFAMDFGRRKSAVVELVLEVGVPQPLGRVKARLLGLVSGAGAVGRIVRARLWAALPASLPPDEVRGSLPSDEERLDL